MNLKSTLSKLSIALLMGFALISSAEAQPKPVKWEAIGKDLYLTRVALFPDAFLTPELLLLRVESSDYRIAVARASDYGELKSDVRSLARRSHALVGINANFFDENGKPLGIVISRGFLYHPLHKGGETLTGIFQVERNRMQIVQRGDFVPGAVLEAVQAGPRLINRGKRVTGQRDSFVTSRRA